MPYLEPTPDGVVIRLFVQPRASRNQLTAVVDAELKVRLTSPPVDGAANALCLKYFAKLLGVPRSELELVAGEKSRHKRLRVSGRSVAAVRAAIESQF